jgi:RHS repeat-associated protein
MHGSDNDEEDSSLKYACKEAQRFGFLDLSLLDFGARMYDPFTARWTKTDNAAAKFPNYSSFAYCGSNPISHVEIDGDIWDTVIDAAFLAYDVGSAIYHGVKGNQEAAKQSLKNVGEDLLFAAIPGATVAVAKGAKALRNMDRAADVGRVAKDYSKAAESMNLGREFEKMILDKVGLKKNTRTFASKTMAGEAINIIPDAVTKDYLIEIKHVVKQSYTKQIQGEVKAARDAGKQFVLFVKKDTKLSETLLNMKESKEIIVIRDWKELLTLTQK